LSVKKKTPKKQLERLSYTRQTMTRAIAAALLKEHGNFSAAARAIVRHCVNTDSKPASVNSVRQWLTLAMAGEIARTKRIYEPENATKVNRILELLDRANIDVDSIGSIDKVKLKAWGVHAKVKERDRKTGKVIGEKIVKDGLYSTNLVLTPSWDAGPQWPLTQPAAPVSVKTTVRARPQRSTKTIVVLSDFQVGFLRDIYDLNKLTPMHDLRAIDVALQIVADVQPDQLGYVGDFLDLSEMSRWLQVEEFFRTTQPAVQAGYEILERFEAAAGPRADREPTMFVAGNHERRLREYLQKHARAAYGLRPALEAPGLTPPDEGNTIGWLLNFKKLGIEYCGEYPGGEWWITDRCVVRHNPLGPDSYSGVTVIAGHSHRVRRETFSRRKRDGLHKYDTVEIGCLCRLDKYGDHKSLMPTRVPSDRAFAKDWAHGFAVVSVADDGTFSVELPDYASPSRAIFRGKEYTTAVDAP
jgi:hypothetical protein